MRTITAHDEDNLRVDQRLLAELKRLGVVETQYDFSRLCGKNPSYFSSMRAKGYGVKLSSLAFLSNRLRKRSSETANPTVSMVLHQANRMVEHAIEEKCRLRELEITIPNAKPALRKNKYNKEKGRRV